MPAWMMLEKIGEKPFNRIVFDLINVMVGSSPIDG
jgi:hypothetical protein